MNYERAKGALWTNRNKLSKTLIGTAFTLGVVSEVLNGTNKAFEGWATLPVKVGDHGTNISLGIGLGKRTLVEDRLHMDGVVVSSPNVGDNFLGIAVGTRSDIGSGMDLIKEDKDSESSHILSVEPVTVFVATKSAS